MRGEDGSMAVAMSAVVATVAVLAVAVASIGTLYAARAQATNAADAAALAAAVATYPPASVTSPVVAASETPPEPTGPPSTSVAARSMVGSGTGPSRL